MFNAVRTLLGLSEPLCPRKNIIRYQSAESKIGLRLARVDSSSDLQY